MKSYNLTNSEPDKNISLMSVWFRKANYTQACTLFRELRNKWAFDLRFIFTFLT